MEVKDAVEAQVSFETPATPRFVVEGQVATLSSPAADATPGFVVLGGLGLVGVVLLVRGIGYTRLGEFFFGLIWSAFIGLMLIVWCKWVPGASKVEFDAQAKHVRIEKRNGRHRTTERIAFADVESIGVTEYMDDASRCFRPVLRTRDARELDLSRENENFLYWHRVMIRVIEITGLTRRDTLIGL